MVAKMAKKRIGAGQFGAGTTHLRNSKAHPMGKQEDKRIALAKRVLDTTDATTLSALESVLDHGPIMHMPESRIKELEALRDRADRGEVELSSWPDVKRRIRRRLRA